MSLQEKSLHVAMELSNKKWRLAFGDGSRERDRVIEARDTGAFLQEVALAKQKLGLAADTPVVSCYEAGRDGFWIHRFLIKHGIKNFVMDPASIEVPRRSRTRKTDRLDAKKLLKLLLRAELFGEKGAFSAVVVPSESAEEELRLHRERDRVVNERTGHRTRIRSLCILHGVTIGNPATANFDDLRLWDGKALPPLLLAELKREQQRLQMIEEQIKSLENIQQEALKKPATRAVEISRKLMLLKGIGIQGGWLLSHECFSWRTFQNRKHLGSFAGLTGTPHDSGDTLREQGISKAGSRRVRGTMIELAWGWVRWQPESALTRWYYQRYVLNGTSRSKRKGIVAVARKLLIALWKYLEQDIVPEGAILKV